MPQEVATVTSLYQALAVIKEMDLNGLEWGGDYRHHGREALKEILEDRMNQDIDRHKVVRSHARRAGRIDRMIPACFVLGVSTRKAAAAFPPVYPGTPLQRCRAHKIRSVLDKARKKDQEEMKRHLHGIMDAKNKTRFLMTPNS